MAKYRFSRNAFALFLILLTLSWLAPVRAHDLCRSTRDKYKTANKEYQDAKNAWMNQVKSMVGMKTAEKTTTKMSKGPKIKGSPLFEAGPSKAQRTRRRLKRERDQKGRALTTARANHRHCETQHASLHIAFPESEQETITI